MPPRTRHGISAKVPTHSCRFMGNQVVRKGLFDADYLITQWTEQEGGAGRQERKKLL